jgi:CRP-like cAMP-binding protein
VASTFFGRVSRLSFYLSWPAGEIKHVMTTAEGDEWILEVLTSGGVFGEPGLFAPEQNRVVNALAIRPCSVLTIDAID